MARDHARIEVTIWANPDFQNLDATAQLVYIKLASSLGLNKVGVRPCLANQIALNTKGLTAGAVTRALTNLEAARFIITDQTTGELLIRTFVRHDGILKSPNMSKAMAADYATIYSEALKQAITTELAKAMAANPDLPGWSGIKATDPGWHDLIQEQAIQALGDGMWDG
jgi:hypothetical protein